MSMRNAVVVLVLAAVLSGCANTNDAARVSERTTAVVLSEPLDLSNDSGPATALVPRAFKLSGKASVIVPAGSTLSGRYVVIADGAVATLWIDWRDLDDLGAGAARNPGRRPAFYSVLPIDIGETGLPESLPAGTTLSLRYDSLRPGGFGQNRDLLRIVD